MKISLDHYYNILKEKAGNLSADERLQLKLVADTIDVSSKSSAEGGYEWFTRYTILLRADKSIQPTPVSGELQTALAALSDIYGLFLRRLRQYVVKNNLSPDEQRRIAEIDTSLEARRQRARDLARLDRQDWREYAEIMGLPVGDNTAYGQWSSQFGRLREIQDLIRVIQELQFDKKTILDRQYPQADDREIVEAEAAFENPAMRLRYPIFPDTDYPNGKDFNAVYLSVTLPTGSTALFDDRRVVSIDKTLSTIKTEVAGAFTASLNQNTSESQTIRGDWGASASGSYLFFSARGSASENRTIQEDFSKGLTISLGAKSAFRLNLIYPPWFKPTLFSHRHVKKNVRDFEEFFGSRGSLRYYPTSLVVVRGFSVEFDSRQNWTYDYKKSFSASGGGGFNAFGISFGGSGSYNSNVHEHKVDVSNTKLTFADGDDTIRFVGYTVHKNKVFDETATSDMTGTLGEQVISSLKG